MSVAKPEVSEKTLHEIVTDYFRQLPEKLNKEDTKQWELPNGSFMLISKKHTCRWNFSLYYFPKNFFKKKKLILYGKSQGGNRVSPYKESSYIMPLTLKLNYEYNPMKEFLQSTIRNEFESYPKLDIVDW